MAVDARTVRAARERMDALRRLRRGTNVREQDVRHAESRVRAAMLAVQAQGGDPAEYGLTLEPEPAPADAPQEPNGGTEPPAGENGGETPPDDAIDLEPYAQGRGWYLVDGVKVQGRDNALEAVKALREREAAANPDGGGEA